METKNQLSIIIQNSGLEAVEGQTLLEKFGNYEQVAKEWEVKAHTIKVTNANQETEMLMAKTARKKFSDLRIEVEKSRKAMKEQSLRKGQAIDAIARFLVSLIEPIENYLREQEDFVKIEASKKAEIERLEAEKKAEEARLAAIEAERKEQERVRLENERLKKEAEAREKKLAEERAKAEAERLEAERVLKAHQEKAKLEKEAADKKLAEEKAKAEAERKAAEEARLAQEKIIADQKAEAERKAAEQARLLEEEKEKARKLEEEHLSHLVECPQCHHKFVVKQK